MLIVLTKKYELFSMKLKKTTSLCLLRGSKVNCYEKILMRHKLQTGGQFNPRCEFPKCFKNTCLFAAFIPG